MCSKHRVMHSILIVCLSWRLPVIFASRSWDGTEHTSHDKAFLARIRSIGGPLCDAIFGFMRNDPNYLCDPKRTCGDYDSWLQASTIPVADVSRKVVLSIGHNGLGNQFFQHSFAQNVAQHIGASLYLTSMDVTSIGKRVPQNTVQGSQWARGIMEPMFQWDALPASHYARQACASKNASFFARAVDFRSKYRNASSVRDDLLEFLDPTGRIGCLVLVGYFQNKANPCLGNVRRVFSGMASLLPPPQLPPPLPFSTSDIVIHMRCAKNAFLGFGRSKYQTLLQSSN